MHTGGREGRSYPFGIPQLQGSLLGYGLHTRLSPLLVEGTTTASGPDDLGRSQCCHQKVSDIPESMMKTTDYPGGRASIGVRKSTTGGMDCLA